MITKFKLFENKKFNPYKLKDKSFWIIRGNRDEILEILNIIEENSGIVTTLNNDDEQYENLIGIYLAYVVNHHHQTYEYNFYDVLNESDILKGKSYYNSAGFKFEGGLFLKNGVVMINTLEKAVDKYNL